MERKWRLAAQETSREVLACFAEDLTGEGDMPRLKDSHTTRGNENRCLCAEYSPCERAGTVELKVLFSKEICINSKTPLDPSTAPAKIY